MTRNWDILKNVNEWVRASDTKAAAVLAFCGASVVFLGAHIVELRTIILEHANRTSGVVLYVALLLYGFGLVGAVSCAFMSVWPRTKNGEKRSLLFFGHIANDFKSGEDYASKVRTVSDDALDEEIARQAWANAIVASNKMVWVNRSLKFLCAASVCWVVCVGIWFMFGS